MMTVFVKRLTGFPFSLRGIGWVILALASLSVVPPLWADGILHDSGTQGSLGSQGSQGSRGSRSGQQGVPRTTQEVVEVRGQQEPVLQAGTKFKAGNRVVKGGVQREAPSASMQGGAQQQRRTPPPAGRPAPANMAGSGLRLEGVPYFYMAEADARYHALKNRWLTMHKGQEPGWDELIALSYQAEDGANIPLILQEWQSQGGASPRLIYPSLHLVNEGREAYLNLTFTATIQAYVGEWRVNPQVLLTDVAHLKQTGHWEVIQQAPVTIPVITAGEDALVALPVVSVLELLKRYPNQWPMALNVQVSGHGLQGQSDLILAPDIFLLPPWAN